MKHGGKLLVGLAFGLAAGTAGAANANTADGPYQEIISRNVFALKPPPPPPSPEDTKPPPVKITLTGIASVNGKWALLKTPPPAPSKGAAPGTPPPTEQFYMMRVGEREGDIEVVDIDERAGSVKVKNAGQEYTLTFEKDGMKPPSTTAPVAPAIPGMLPAPGGAVPPPALPGVTPGKPTFPVRPVRGGMTDAGNPGLPGNTGFPPPNYGAPAVGGANPNAVAMPSFYGNQQNQEALSRAATPDKLYTREEQAILIEANRNRTPFSGLMPPTPLNPRANVELPPAPGQNLPAVPGTR